MAAYFIRQAVGAYCIRPSNILSGIILHYAKTRLRCLRQHMWGVCNTPLPYMDKEKFSNGKWAVFCLSNLLFLPWCKKRSKRRSSPLPRAGKFGLVRVWEGVCNTPLPCYKNGIHKIRMYPGRGVLHTPSERFQRKRRDTPRHKNNHSPPPAASGGRMLLRPYIIGMIKNKRSPAYLARDLP